MKQKWRVRTREIYKYKARINIDGSKMRPGVHYNQTYAPVAAWESIIILLYTLLHNNWKMMHINYVLAFTQEPVYR